MVVRHRQLCPRRGAVHRRAPRAPRRRDGAGHGPGAPRRRRAAESPRLSDALPLLAGFGPDDALLLPGDNGAAPAIGAARFCAAVAALSRTLPRARHAIVRCEDTARFMLASAAALTAGHTIVLPQAR